jgi:hydroxymethylpyrimidine pyrophosphatase-like HAD family hydrolase
VKRRLIVCDLDGTLLDSSGHVSPRTRAAVDRVQELGHVFVIATARPVRDTRKVARAFGQGAVAVCGNGSIVFDFVREEVVGYHPLTRQSAREALGALRSRFPGVRLGAECRLDLVLERPFDLPGSLAREAHRVTLLEEALDGHGPGKLMVQLDGSSDAYYDDVRDILTGCEVTVSGTGFCEVMSAGVTKASALARVARELGLDSADAVAFGDMPNDLSMLAWSGTGVAVANAHPLVIESADEVTASNDDDGVAVWLERIQVSEEEKSR